MNIELTDEAIEQGKQIRFEYYRYGTDKKLHKTRAHHASPYQLILHNQRYGINYKELSTSLPYMFSDRPVWTEFTADKDLADQIIDWFGKDIRLDGYGDKQIKVTVKVSPSAMEHWALQYAGYVTVTSPQSLVDSIKNRLQTAMENIKNKKQRRKEKCQFGEFKQTQVEEMLQITA